MATLPTPGARTQLAKTVGTPTTLPQQGPPPGFTPSPAAPATAPARNIPAPSLTPGERAAIGATPAGLGGTPVLAPQPAPQGVDPILMANMRMPSGGQGVFPTPGARTQVAQAAGTPMGLPPTQAPPGYVSTPLTDAQQQQIAAQGATLTPNEIAARTEALMAQRQEALELARLRNERVRLGIESDPMHREQRMLQQRQLEEAALAQQENQARNAVINELGIPAEQAAAMTTSQLLQARQQAMYARQLYGGY
jgi:hypothetical protein